MQQSNPSVITPLANSTSNNSGLGLTYQFSASSLVGMSGNYYFVNYGSLAGTPGTSGFIDSRSASAASFYAHRFSNRHWLGATYNFQQLMFNPGGRTTIHRVLGFYSLTVGSHMTLSFWAGPQYSTSFISNVLVLQPTGRMLALPSQWSPAAGAMFDWQGSHTSLHAGYSQQISDGGGLAEAVTIKQVDAEISRRLATRWTATSGSAYARNNPLHMTSGLRLCGRFKEPQELISSNRQPGNERSIRTTAAAIRVPPAAQCDRQPESRVVLALLRFCSSIGKVIMPEVLDDPSLEKTDWRKHWRMLCRRRWWLALPAFGIWMAVWACAWFLPAVYRSETVILLEQQKVPEQYVVPNVSADLQDQLQNMSQQILGRERLLDIMRDFNLYPALRARVTGDEMIERMRKDIQVELVQAPNRSGNLSAFKVAYMSKDPALAQKVTAQLTSLFINENLKNREKQSSQTTQFLGEQLEDAGRRLAEQEAKVKEFKTQYLGQLPEQVQSNVQILSGLQAQLQQESDALDRAKQQSVYLGTLRAQWRTAEASVGPGNPAGTAALPTLDQELARLRAATGRPSFSLHRTPSGCAEGQRADCKDRETEAASRGKKRSICQPSGADDTVHASSPTGMEVESQLKANKLEIENRQHAVQDLQKRIGEYQAPAEHDPHA